MDSVNGSLAPRPVVRTRSFSEPLPFGVTVVRVGQFVSLESIEPWRIFCCFGLGGVSGSCSGLLGVLGWTTTRLIGAGRKLWRRKGPAACFQKQLDAISENDPLPAKRARQMRTGAQRLGAEETEQADQVWERSLTQAND